MENIALIPRFEGDRRRGPKPPGWAIHCQQTDYWFNGASLREACWSKARSEARRYPTKRRAMEQLLSILRQRERIEKGGRTHDAA